MEFSVTFGERRDFLLRGQKAQQNRPYRRSQIQRAERQDAAFGGLQRQPGGLSAVGADGDVAANLPCQRRKFPGGIAAGIGDGGDDHPAAVGSDLPQYRQASNW